MASKSLQHEPEKAEVIEEALEHLETTLDRVKVLYEQFFLGIQKQPPAHLHTDVERKLRELQQMQIRNTALRYRFATVQQKFGSYNNYWRRTLRQIENGTYHRNLAKIGRQAAVTGEDIPDEILAAMPKRMREQVKRDREAALAQKRRRDQSAADDAGDFLEEAATGTSPPPRKTAGGAHVVDESEEFDLDAYFRAVTNDDSPSAEQTSPAAPAFVEPAPPPPPAQPPRQTQPIAAVAAPHPNPAVRAAVGMRIATPPAGVPASRMTPMPGQHAQHGLRDSQQIATQPIPRPGTLPGKPVVQDSQQIPTQALPTIRTPAGGLPAIPKPPGAPLAPSQVARPLPVMPGAASVRGPVPVETLAGPFPRAQTQGPQRPSAPPQQRPAPPAPPAGRSQAIPTTTQAIPRPQPTDPRTTQPIKPTRATTEPGVAAPARTGPPPGMTDADVNALYAKYVKAKEAVGEKAGPGSYGKLLQTINAQAPKIMEQYKAKGVDFQVVVKDNQVVIRAKPKP